MFGKLSFFALTTGGTSIITDAMKQSMQGGIDNLIATYNDVIGLIIKETKNADH